eukprot:1226939-Rhodomonas_salina.1
MSGVDSREKVVGVPDHCLAEPARVPTGQGVSNAHLWMLERISMQIHKVEHTQPPQSVKIHLPPFQVLLHCTVKVEHFELSKIEDKCASLALHCDKVPPRFALLDRHQRNPLSPVALQFSDNNCCERDREAHTQWGVNLRHSAHQVGPHPPGAG